MVGTLFGMHYDSLLFGLLGGLIFLSRSAKVARAQALSGVLSSALLAGTFAQSAAVLTLAYFSVAKPIGEDSLRRAAAMSIGACWQVGVPMALSIVRNWASKASATVGS